MLAGTALAAGRPGAGAPGATRDGRPLLARQCPPPLHVCAPAEQVPQGVAYRLDTDPHVWLASQTPGCNLAQGPFAPQPPRAGWPRWRAVAAVLAIGWLAHVGFHLAQGAQLRLAGEALARDNARFYQQLFPQDRVLIDLRRQFDQHLAQGGGVRAEGLLGLLGQAAPALLKAERLQLQQLDYSAQRGELAVQVLAPSFEALERLREGLSGSGLAVQLGAASREEDGVSARLVIGG